MFAEKLFEDYPAVILHDDLVDGLVRKGCSGAEDGVGGGLDKLLVHYDKGLTGF